MIEFEDDPEGPDPGERGARFLGWLKRSGAGRNLGTCRKKSEHLGLNLDQSIDEWGDDRICKASSRGDKVLWLKDTDWADAWAKFHRVEVPHHRQPIDIK